jgi:hypothetical protein
MVLIKKRCSGAYVRSPDSPAYSAQRRHLLESAQSYAALTRSNHSSSERTFTPSSSAFLSFEPAPGPATK